MLRHEPASTDGRLASLGSTVFVRLPHSTLHRVSGRLAMLIVIAYLIPGCDGVLPSGDASVPDDASPDASQLTDGGQSDVALPCLDCHTLPMGRRRAVVDESGAGGHTFGEDPLTEGECRLCHETTQHAWGTVRLWENPVRPAAVVELAHDPAVEPPEGAELAKFCQACHGDTDYAAHEVRGDWQPTCTDCHNLHEPDSGNLMLVSGLVFNRTLEIESPVAFTARTGLGSFDDGDLLVHNGICQVCHTDTFYHLHDGTAITHFDGEDCTICHPHDAGFITTDETSCVICHSRQQGSRHAVVDAAGAGGHAMGNDVLTKEDCVLCHETTRHREGRVRLWANPNDQSSIIELSGDPSHDPAAAGQLISFCGACHDEAEFTVHDVDGGWQPACTECHDLHDPANTNLGLVSASIRNQTLSLDRPVALSSRTGAGSFSAGDPLANEGVCQVCHTQTAFHLHDGTGTPHLEGDDCTTCHAHDTGFVPDRDTTCSVCHSVAQGRRRPVTGEFGLASSHLHGGYVVNADCLVCHDAAEHQQGQVRLINPDDPVNPAARIALTDSPMISPSEAAKLEPFCLACHDGDGAHGAAPFTDGVIPPAIDTTLWASASHGAGQMTCLGNGETFGCHSTGHGSVKVNLLAPWDGSPVGVDGDAAREEEGLCYSCHDEDGPAATDVESDFALATRHNVSSLDQTDGSRVECIDCHDPHQVSAATPLTDPDSRGVWMGTSERFCLTCHDGSPPASVSFPPASPGTGFDKSAFVGTTHDGELGESSCRHCHRVHGSSNLATLKEKYIVEDYNEYATGDGDFAACWLCHDERDTIERENAFEFRHEKHVKDERSPCILCHDVHRGVDPGEPGLIDMAYTVQKGYDTEFIEGADGSSSFWIDLEENEGNCLVQCHGERHEPKDYDPARLDTTDCSACH